MWWLDDALDHEIERPLEDGREGRTRHLMVAFNIDLDGAVAEIPRVWYREACVGVSAEGNWREGFFAHGYVDNGLFAVFVDKRWQLGFKGWVLLPTVKRDREGGVADQGGD